MKSYRTQPYQFWIKSILERNYLSIMKQFFDVVFDILIVFNDAHYVLLKVFYLYNTILNFKVIYSFTIANKTTI